MINIPDKSTTITGPAKVAGLHPSDSNIEFIGVTKTLQVLWMRNGNTLPWQFLPKDVYRKCQQLYLSDASALEHLGNLNLSLDRQIELYIYHLYGDVDTTADFINGKLQPSENFRHVANCPSLNYDNKWITIDGIPLTARDLKIIDLIKKDTPDKAIAAELEISQSTFDFHKRNLMQKVGVKSKTNLLIKALNQHV